MYQRPDGHFLWKDSTHQETIRKANGELICASVYLAHGVPDALFNWLSRSDKPVFAFPLKMFIECGCGLDFHSLRPDCLEVKDSYLFDEHACATCRSPLSLTRQAENVANKFSTEAAASIGSDIPDGWR